MDRIHIMRRMMGSPHTPTALLTSRGWDVDVSDFQLGSVSDEFIGGTLRRLSRDLDISSFLIVRDDQSVAPTAASSVPEVPPLSRLTLTRVQEMMKDISLFLCEPDVRDFHDAQVRLRSFIAGAQAHFSLIHMNTIPVQKAMRLYGYLGSCLRGARQTGRNADTSIFSTPKRALSEDTEPPLKKAREMHVQTISPPGKKARSEAQSRQTESQLFTTLMATMSRFLPNLVQEPITTVEEARKRVLAAALIGAEIHASFWPLLAEIEEHLTRVKAPLHQPQMMWTLTEGVASKLGSGSLPPKIALVGALPEGMLLAEARRRLAVLLPQTTALELYGEHAHPAWHSFSSYSHWMLHLPPEIDNPKIVDMVQVISGVLTTALT